MGYGRMKKVSLWFAAFLVFFTIVGFFILPPIIKSVLTKKLSETLHRQVTVQSVRINPYSLTVKIGGVTVKEGTGNDTFLRFDELAVGLDPSSLVRRALILRRVTLKKPYVRVALRKDGFYNFSDILTSQTSSAAKDSGKKTPFRFSLSNIQLMDGSIDFLDEPKDGTHTVRQMTVNVPFLSNVSHHADVFVQPYFSANINGSPYVVRGKTKPFRKSYESYINISIVQLDIARYAPYIPEKMGFALASALLDLDAKVSFMLDKDPSLVVSGTATFSDVAVNDLHKKPLLRLPSAVFIVDALEPLKRSVHLLNMTLKSPEVTMRRLENGTIDLTSIFKDSDKSSQDAGKAKDVEQGAKADQSRDGEAFSFTLDEFLLDGGTATFEDHTFAPPVSTPLKNIIARARGVSTNKDASGNVSLSFEATKKGAVSAKGTLSLNPLSLDLALDVKNVSVAPFQPYFQDKVKIAVTRGSLSSSGRLTVKADETGEPKLGFAGGMFLSNFSSIDRIKGDPFLEWKNLAFTRMDARFEPLYLHVGGVALTDFYSRIIVNPDGSTNLQKILGDEEGEGSPAPTSIQEQPKSSSASHKKDTGVPDIRINTVTLQGGRVDFADRRIKPNYETELTELAGRVSNISLKQGGMAQLEVLGKIEKHIPLKINGSINPSPKALLVDLTASFHDLDISPMTPYAAKYVGYTIEKGKLSIDVKYMVNNRKLDSQNLILLDQFTFGDRVESPDATSLPVRLAVALLKDRSGQIKLNIPVSGSIDDPQFSIGRIILRIIVNLITKAVTSPFALLSSLFGGGEELGYVEFDYGSSRIEGPRVKKIETLAKALYERPSLKLDVEGHVDVERDKEALRQYFFTKKVKTQKLNDILKQRLRPTPVDDIKIETAEYEKYLRRAYNAEKFPKPRNIIGLTKTIPPAEMEKLMLTHIIVKDDDLRTLALQRARMVADALLKSQNIPAERVFVVEPKSLTSEDKQNVKKSRVDFRLK